MPSRLPSAPPTPTPAACSKPPRNCSPENFRPSTSLCRKSVRLAHRTRGKWGTQFRERRTQSSVGRARRAEPCDTAGMAREPGTARDLIEVTLGFGLILFVLWMPSFPQRILSPVAFVVTLGVVLARRQSLDELGLGRRGLAASLWILPAAMLITLAGVLIARRIGTLHALYQAALQHIAGYVLWTLYQQCLLNDLFMPRLTRLLANQGAALGISSALFAAAHL